MISHDLHILPAVSLFSFDGPIVSFEFLCFVFVCFRFVILNVSFDPVVSVYSLRLLFFVLSLLVTASEVSDGLLRRYVHDYSCSQGADVVDFS